MNIALIGLGIVGRGVYDLIMNHHPDLHIQYVLEKDPQKLEGIRVDHTKSLQDILNDPHVDVVIELVGGKQFAYEVVSAALKAKKHVVTANKALISDEYASLHQLAYEHSVHLLYEAAVGGAIHILAPLKKIAAINPIHRIEGILNGTTNFILDQIFLHDLSKEEAILKADHLGYLEKGSNDDLEGWDTLRKINILAMMSFHTVLLEKDIIRVSLESLSESFIAYAKQQKKVIKYVACAFKKGHEVMVYVVPKMMPSSHLYTHIQNEYNVIELYGEYHEKQMFIGQGAGRYPTATAVISDLLSLHDLKAVTPLQNKPMSVNANVQTFDFLVLKKGVITQVHQTFEAVLGDADVTSIVMMEAGQL
jgi:homoserine dehydrogenase